MTRKLYDCRKGRPVYTKVRLQGTGSDSGLVWQAEKAR